MFSIQKDLLYKNDTSLTAYESERCRLDLYSPQGDLIPWLVWFHGGGLTEGDKTACSDLAQWLAENGVGVALCNYRLSPKVKYPAYLEDALAAFIWLHQYLGERGEDNRNMFVGGHSAGGYLAALMALKPNEFHLPIRGVIPMSGQMVTHFTVRAERGIGPNQVLADEAAPIFHVTNEAPPFCVMISENDIPGRLEENAYFAAMMKVAGNRDTDFHTFPNRDHGSISDLFASPNDAVCGVLLEFIRKWTR